MGRRNGGSRNNSPSRPSTSQEAASAPSVGRNSPSGQTLLPDSDDRGIERLPEISVMEELFQKISQLTLEVQNLRFQNSELEARISRPSTPVSVREAPPVEFVVQRDPIPQFKAEVSSAHPLKRNQEVESWLRSVENHTRPQTDAAFIKAAKASWITDYPRALVTHDLIRRVFLQGLPRWIREAVVVKEEAELCNLVETTQRVWSLRESEGPGVSSPTRSPFRPRFLQQPRSGVAATPSLASKEVLSTTDCDNEVLQKPAGRPMVSLMVNGFKTQCFVDTGFDAVGDFGGADDYILLPDVDLPPCSVVTQTPVGVDQSGSSTDCPEDVQLKDAELGDLLSEIDLGHLTLEQQQQLRQVLVKYVALFDAQANGMIERTNRVVKNALATLLEASPLEWDELLPYVRLAMNSAVHRSVGDQPLYLLTGHIGTYPVGNSNYEETDHEAAQSFAARLRRAREIAVETSVQAREGWARDYNRRTRKSTFAAEVGDLVLFKDLPRMAGAGRRGALGPRWFGPARICKKTGPVTRLTGSRRMILQLLSWLPFADLLTMVSLDWSPSLFLLEGLCQ
ncbi:hypothetical protein C7M84_019943 [Penaeus vannamei]|uniref:Integrase catalytic domain-containing protein n=1 Tax=Penaeus vannamei TaxID=6689 RepID=A0A3R7LT64_PENVA|nr:hypothetical protein C7M84_019943 [Penaeus vannamei]